MAGLIMQGILERKGLKLQGLGALHMYFSLSCTLVTVLYVYFGTSVYFSHAMGY